MNRNVPYVKYLEVTARQGESADRMIKRFTKKVRNDGILDEVRERRFYRKPSEWRRLKENQSEMRRRSIKIDG